MALWKRILILSFSLFVFIGAGVGVRTAIRSPLFLVRVVEVADQPEGAPLDAQGISGLAQVPLGRVNLFELDLKGVERRVLSNPWIEKVHLRKRFPQTLSISVNFKEPRALFQEGSGELGYVDRSGKIFGKFALERRSDLPVLSGFPAEEGILRQAVNFLMFWEKSQLSREVRLSTLIFDRDRGFVALTSYPLHRAETDGYGRAMVRIGNELSEDNLEIKLDRLSRVFQYLSNNRILARQVWADLGKKIVVRTSRGS